MDLLKFLAVVIAGGIFMTIVDHVLGIHLPAYKLAVWDLSRMLFGGLLAMMLYRLPSKAGRY